MKMIDVLGTKKLLLCAKHHKNQPGVLKTYTIKQCAPPLFIDPPGTDLNDT